MAFLPTLNRPRVVRIGSSYNPDNGTTTAHSYEIERKQAMIRYGKGGNYGYPNFPEYQNVGQSWCLERHDVNYGLLDVGTCYAQGPYKGFTFSGSLRDDFKPGTPWDRLFPVDDWGPKAYSKMKPTKPVFSGLNALVELREVPKLLRQRLTGNGLKDVSSYWLALQFGWKPLLSDIRNMVNVQMLAQQRLQQLLRDNGKPVRRRITLQDTLDGPHATHGLSVLPFPYLVNYFYNGSPRTSRAWHVRDRVWASARFRYWLPEGPRDVKWRRRMLRALYGLNPSPSVIYNAIPWSWLVDWFSTVGDSLSNLEAGVADRLSADYFYVMREVEYISTQTTTLSLYRQNGEIFSTTGTSQQTSVVKTRGVGDPFGWRTSPSTLSGMQLSILGALGLSRL